MITLGELCAAMAASGRVLTPRAARDWWTKGLLPRPQRRGLGRGIGTETYWSDPRVKAQAEATYDFLAWHSRTYWAALHLWLSGFPVDLHLVRGAYQRLIAGHFRVPRRRSADDPEDAISALAASAARHIMKSKPAPPRVLHAVTDLVLPYLQIFFGSAEEFECTGLSALWAITEPYLGHAKGQEPFLPSDNDFETAALYLGRMAALTMQSQAIADASDYEMARARRLMLFVAGHLQRISKLLKDNRETEEFGRPLLIGLGRLAIPILITVLRDDSLRNKTVPFLLDFAIKIRGPLRQGWTPANLPAIHYDQ